MPDANDIALLREYAERNSEPAFAELVHRHINLVYSVALRFTGNCEDAQDATQAVFIILAQKASSLNQRTILTGWLYETTRFTAMRLLRTKARQQAREQEAYMQSTLNDPDADGVWKQLAPLLEEAMARLNEKERTLLALRFFENKTSAETAAILGIREWAARKRVGRAMEKLQRHFSRRGVNSTTAIIAGAISANSVQAAPVGLAKTISAVAITKGAAASTSTLTLIKGALKIMAWSKMKTVVVTGAIVLFAAGTTTVAVKEIQKHNADDSWRVRYFDSKVLDQAYPQVEILAARFPGTGSWGESNGKKMGVGITVQEIVMAAYDEGSSARTIALTKLPSEKYDYIANLPGGLNDNMEALQREVKKKFGLIGRHEMLDTDVLLLTVKQPNAPGLKRSAPNKTKFNDSSMLTGNDEFTAIDLKVHFLASYLEGYLKFPVIDKTGLLDNFDFNLKWNNPNLQYPNTEGLKQALLDQLGLELVPTNMPIEMLVVEKAN